MFHFFPADQVQVQVIDSLAPVRAGVDDDAITVGVDFFLFGDLPGDLEEMPHQGLVFNAQIVERVEMFVRHDQNVRRGDGVNVAKSSRAIVAMDDCRFGFAGDDFAENTSWIHLMPDERKSGVKVNGKVAKHGSVGAGLSRPSLVYFFKVLIPQK